MAYVTFLFVYGTKSSSPAMLFTTALFGALLGFLFGLMFAARKHRREQLKLAQRNRENRERLERLKRA